MPRVKIGIDLSTLVYAGSGVATYTFELAKNLLKIDDKNTYVGFYSSLRRPQNFYYLDELKRLGAEIYDYRLPPTLLRFIWGRNQLIPIEWLIGKVDIYHSSDFLRPPTIYAKGVTTVHDLTWQFYPEYHTKEVVEAHERKIQLTLKYDDEIITVSESTKRDLCKVFNINQNKIHVIYEGVDHKKFKVQSFDKAQDRNEKLKIRRILEKYKIAPPYILYVGAIEPRKNLLRLIEAFHLLLKHRLENYHLIIAGRIGWKNEEIFRLVKRLGLETRITFSGFVQDADLPYLYAGASVFVYPSLYEGFGLPVLEAMVSGCPVVTSANSSLIEVAGKAAVYIDVKSSRSIAEGIKKVLMNKDFTQKLTNLGLTQAAKFTWTKTAEETLKVYEEVYKRRSG